MSYFFELISFTFKLHRAFLINVVFYYSWSSRQYAWSSRQYDFGEKIQRLKFIAALMYFSLTNPFVIVWKMMMKNQSLIILVVSYVIRLFNIVKINVCQSYRYRSIRWCIFHWLIQKQPSRGVSIKRCFENMQKIYRRTPMSKCDFNKVALQPVNLLHIFRTAFPKNTSGRLLLLIHLQ